MSSVLWSYWLVSLSPRHSARAQLTQAWPQAHRQRVQPSRDGRALVLEQRARSVSFAHVGSSGIFELNLGLGCKSGRTKWSYRPRLQFTRPAVQGNANHATSFLFTPPDRPPYPNQPCMATSPLPRTSYIRRSTNGCKGRSALEHPQLIRR